MALAPLPPIPNTRLVDDPTRDAIWRRYLEQLFNRVIPLNTGTVTSINVSSVASGLTFTGGPVSTAGTIVMGGTLNVSSGGSGANTLTGYLIGNGTSPFTATTAIHTSTITGVLPIANGGTATSTPLTSSAVMVSNGTAIVQGPLGTSTTVLHGNTSLPFYSAVVLTADVTGVLPAANGGTGFSAPVSSMAFQSSSGVAIVGGTINGTAIGGTTVSTGAFSTVNVSTGNLTVSVGDIVFVTDPGVIRSNTSDGSDSKDTRLLGGGGTGDTRGGSIICAGNENSNTGAVIMQAGNVTGGIVRWVTGGADRARITEAGLFLVGTTVTTIAGRVFQVAGTNPGAFKDTSGTAANEVIDVWQNATSGDNAFISFFTETAITGRGSITYNRGGGLVAYNTTSDERAKTVRGLFQNPGALIDAVPVYDGRMNGAAFNMPTMKAHELQAVAPYAVTGQRGAMDKDGTPVMQQVSFPALIPLMWAELQSLRSRLAQLENR